jgi:hypothetical protein
MKNLLKVVVVVSVMFSHAAFSQVDMEPCGPEGCGDGVGGGAILFLLLVVGGLYVLLQLKSSFDETEWGKRRSKANHQKAVAEANEKKKAKAAAWTWSDVEFRHRIYQQYASDPYRSFENREHFAKFADISVVHEEMNQERHRFGLPPLTRPE